MARKPKTTAPLADNEYYIVWNPGRTEGFVTNDRADAVSAVTGNPNYTLGYPSQSTAGAAFHDTYEDDDLTLETVAINAVVSA